MIEISAERGSGISNTIIKSLPSLQNDKKYPEND